MPEVIIIGNPLANTYCMARSLHKHGIKPVLFLEPTAYKGLKYSRFFSTIHTLAHLEDVIGLLLELYGNESEKPILLCGSDPAVCILDANYNLLKDKFVFFNAGKEGRINTLMDKLTTFPLAEQNQFNLIKTWSVKYGDNVPDDIIYPCIIKGNNSTKSSKMDMTVCYNQA